MKFKVDENLPIEVARILADAGHDALTVFDQGLAGIKDHHLITHCDEEKRTLLTLDIGFGDIRNYEHSDHPGMIVLRLRHLDKDHILGVVSRLLGILKKESVGGKLWIVEESRVRIRE